MTILLYAQPYDISAEGFYFRNVEDYEREAKACRNSFGQPVEEFEIEFIDGGHMDCELARAIGLNQANFALYLDRIDAWNVYEMQAVIIAVGECGYAFTEDTAPDDLDIDVYHVDSMRDLAIELVEEGLFGDIPKPLESYIDYDAIARDLAVDYSEAIIWRRAAGLSLRIGRDGTPKPRPAKDQEKAGASGCNSAPSNKNGGKP